MQDRTPAAEVAEAALPDGAVLVGAGGHTDYGPGYRTYVLVMLTLTYVVSYLDRTILGILNPSIKAEFHLSDFQVGILGGVAFALVYASLGVPLAILADRANRRNVVAISVAIFSVMTVLCGYCSSYWQLIVARFGTGLGEAGTTPSINSVLADLYPPKQRASALAFYSAGLNIGILVGFISGGWINDHYGWRNAFVAAGAPGLLLMLLVLLTVKEPRRGHVENLADTSPVPSIWATIAHLWSLRSFRWMSIGTAMSSFGGYAGITFIPIFLSVSHHMTSTEIGLALALLSGTCGAVGTYMSGVIADRVGKRNIRYNMYVPVVAAFIALPFIPVYYLAPTTAVALTAAIIPSLMGASYLGPAYAMTQAMVPLRMRARAIAILLFVLNIIAYSLGPPVVGKISDLLKPMLGSDSVRWALMSTIITALLGAYCYWRSTKTLEADVRRGSAA